MNPTPAAEVVAAVIIAATDAPKVCGNCGKPHNGQPGPCNTCGGATTEGITAYNRYRESHIAAVNAFEQRTGLKLRAASVKANKENYCRVGYRIETPTDFVIGELEMSLFSPTEGWRIGMMGWQPNEKFNRAIGVDSFPFRGDL